MERACIGRGHALTQYQCHRAGGNESINDFGMNATIILFEQTGLTSDAQKLEYVHRAYWRMVLQ